VADALIIEMYGEVLAADVAGADDHCFITSNIKDFSLGTGDSRLPHADIAEYFANPRSRYFTSLATAVSAYFPSEETDDLVAELAFHDEPRNLSEIMPLLDKLWDQFWYNRHQNLAYEIEVGEVEIVEEYTQRSTNAPSCGASGRARWPQLAGWKRSGRVGSGHGMTSSGGCSLGRCRP